MMRRNVIRLFFAVLVLWAGAACSRDDKPQDNSTVTLTFRTGDPVTRAGDLGDGQVDDGGGIAVSAGVPDLMIIIADETGQIVKRYCPSATDGVTITPALAGTSATEVSALFTWGDTPGEGVYTVYALANTQAAGSNLSIASAPTWASFTDASVLDDLLFTALTGTTTPDVGDRMPLTAKGTLEVRKNVNSSKYNGLVELRMLRSVAKVQLGFKNLTKAELNIYNCQLTLYDMNTRQGYLFTHTPDFVELGDLIDNGTGDATPDGKEDNYRNYTTPVQNLLKICGTDDAGTDDVDERTLMGEDDPLTVGVDEREPAALDAFLVFPSTAPMQTVPSKGNRYLCDISFRIQKEGETYDPLDDSTYEEKSFTALPIHDALSRDILSLSRNQLLKIETTISKKAATKDISFNFIVCNWTQKKEEVIFH